jgi:hypothetical protein
MKNARKGLINVPQHVLSSQESETPKKTSDTDLPSPTTNPKNSNMRASGGTSVSTTNSTSSASQFPPIQSTSSFPTSLTPTIVSSAPAALLPNSVVHSATAKKTQIKLSSVKISGIPSSRPAFASGSTEISVPSNSKKLFVEIGVEGEILPKQPVTFVVKASQENNTPGKF